MRTQKIIGIVLALTYLLIYSACTRKAIITPGFEHAFRQGTTDNLYKIKDFQVFKFDQLPSVKNAYKKKEKKQSKLKISLDELKNDKSIIAIHTTKKGTPVKISTGGGNIHVDSKLSFINQYYLVKYELKEPLHTSQQKLIYSLLGDIENFKGFPDTNYYIVPHLQDDYLILYRVAQKNKIPYDEYSLGLRLSKKLMATPLIGYKINYCQAEVVKNANNEDTGLYRPKCEKIPVKEANYIRFDRSSKEVFAYQSKVDIFPTNFFTGKWFFTWTVIESSEKTSATVGQHIGMTDAKLVEFKRETNRLLAVDASGNNLEDKDKEQALSIPVAWKEYEFTNDSNQLVEQEKTNNINTKRPYFKILFDKLMANNSQILKDITITDHYFSYSYDINYKHPQNGEDNFKKIKVAFMKFDSDTTYPEKQWFETNSTEFFPHFSVMRKHYQDASAHTKADKHKLTRVARFNPNKKIIKWHFSKGTSSSKWVRGLGKKAIQLWNKAFLKAAEGTGKEPIQVVLDESQDQELGDIRFNTLNLIESKEEQKNSGLLGIAPNVANPITGEVISGTANVYITATIDMYIYMIRDFIRLQIFPPSWTWKPNDSSMSLFIKEQIQILCPEVTDFIRQHQNIAFHPIETNLKDKEIIKSCAERVAKPHILNIILHEMGHSFSLRHLFSASADKQNSYKTYNEIINIFGNDILKDATPSYPGPGQYSSVMDYSNVRYPSLTVPGKYDIAAIRFLYYDQVETTDGRKIEIPDHPEENPKSIKELSEEQNVKIKVYKICGGGKKYDIDIDDPLCNRGDYGSTPLEIVEYNIRDFKNHLHSLKRYDSEMINSMPFSTALLSLQNINSIFKKWEEKRQKILESTRNNIWQYSIDNADEYKNLIKNEADKNSEFKAYYDARNAILKFYKEIYFLPAKHCIFQKPDKSYQAISIHQLIRIIAKQYSDSHRAIVKDCLSPAIVKWTKKNKMSLAAEVGFFAATRPYFIPGKAKDLPDEQSVFETVLNPIHFMPALTTALNEPDFKWEMYKSIQDYLLNGSYIKPYLNNTTDEQIPNYITTYLADSERSYFKRQDTMLSFLDNAFFMLYNLTGNTQAMAAISSKNINNLVAELKCFPLNITSLSMITIAPSHQSPLKHYPLLYDLQKQHSENVKNNPDANFIDLVFEHPYIYHVPTAPELICAPKETDSFIGKIIYKYKQYKECIDNHNQDTACQDRESKIAFTEFVSKMISGRF